MERFRPDEFGLLLIDEAHRSPASTYRRIIEHFRQNPDLCVVGVTATPDRLDNIGLGCVFEDVSCNLDLSWGIENCWLVPPKQMLVDVDGLDLTQVRTAGGDLDSQQLQRILEIEENLHAMAKPIVDTCGRDKQAIVFAASVKQAHRICEIIRDYHEREFGQKCEAVSIDGSLGAQDPKRISIVSDFKAGKTQYLCNCGVATEGFDVPNVRVIAIGRPTKSRALYLQMLGRGTRPLPGVVDGEDTVDKRKLAIAASDKPHCTVIDFVGQSGRHKLVCSADVLAGDEPPEVIDRARQIVSNPNFDGNTLDAIHEAREKLAAEREARRAKVTVGVNYSMREAKTVYDMATVPTARCPGYLQSRGPTEKQAKMMMRLGYTQAQVDKMNPRSASAAIDHAIKNPRNGFGRWLHDKKKEDGTL